MKNILVAIIVLVSPSCWSHQEEATREGRTYIISVCYNPDSVWHLSECNEECTRRDYSGEAYCLPLFDTMCEQPGGSDFVRMACGFYYE